MQDSAKEQGVGSRKGSSVTLRQWKNHPSYKHRVSWIEDGSAVSRGFKLKKDAEAFQAEKAAELRAHGLGESPTSQERSAIIEGRESLAKVGLSLRDAIKLAVDIRERESRSVPVDEVVSKVLKAKADTGKGARHLSDLKYRLGLFKETFGDRVIFSITHEEVFDWIQSQSDSHTSRNNFRRHVRLLFNFAKKRKYTSENPVDLVEEWKGPQSEVEVIQPDEMRKFLEAAPSEIIPVLTIGAFAGLRRSELKRLRWQDVDLETGEIFVRALNHKSAANRIVPIESNLSDWLRPFATTDGLVWPKAGDRLFTEAKKAVSFEVPKNVLRHCYASYHIAKYNDGPLISLNLGQPNARQVFDSYRKPIRKSHAEAYWNIFPKQPENIVKMAS